MLEIMKLETAAEFVNGINIRITKMCILREEERVRIMQHATLLISTTIDYRRNLHNIKWFV